MHTPFFRRLQFLTSAIVFVFSSITIQAQENVFKNLSILPVKTNAAGIANTAADLLGSEVNKRTGLSTAIVQSLPTSGNVIILKTRAAKPLGTPASVPSLKEKPEAYRIYQFQENNRQIITVEGF